MNDEYKEYEKACVIIRQENELLLDDFVRMLESQNLAPRTIKKHRDNVDLFINEFLLYDGTVRPADGIGDVSMYFGDWFIRKAMWSSPSSIKANSVSLYKFYTFLAASEKVTVEELVQLKVTIAVHLPEWQARGERYNEGDTEDWRGLD